MEEYIKLIKKVNEILTSAKQLSDESARTHFLQESVPTFAKFKDALPEILRNYQFKEADNTEQNQIADVVKNNIIGLFNLDGIFHDENCYFKNHLITALSYNEEYFAYNLQYASDINLVNSAIEYLHSRDQYIETLKNNNYFDGEELNGPAARSYEKSHFAQSLFGHALMFLKNNYLHLPSEDVSHLLSEINSSSFFKDLTSKPYNKMDAYECNFIYQYCETVLKIKSIITPDELRDDEIIKQFWNGKIENPKILSLILQNTSINSLMDLLHAEKDFSRDGFIKSLSEHFQDTGMSDKSIAIIMTHVFKSKAIPYHYALFLTQIDMPNDIFVFSESPHSKKFPWLKEYTAFDSLKECQSQLENGRFPFLPAEYYMRRIENECNSLDIVTSSDSSTSIDPILLINISTLMNSDFYSQDEKSRISTTLSHNHIYLPQPDSFEKSDTPTETQTKIKQSLYAGQLIPVELAQKIISDDLSNTNPIVSKEVLRASMQSIICSILNDNGIDIQNKVFVGKDTSARGYHNKVAKAIWLNDSILEKYLKSKNNSDKISTLITMFHEMKHAIQYHNISIGKIDFLTYNFIKEDVIAQFDSKFYEENYESFFVETDARIGGIEGTLDFLKTSCPDLHNHVKSYLEAKIAQEKEKHGIDVDFQKKFPIGNKKTISITDYVGLLIKNNPQIIQNEPILQIEYNTDGSQKDIATLLDEFDQIASTAPSNYQDLYSIYAGLLIQKQDSIPKDNPKLAQRVSTFFKDEHALITMQDMQQYYSSASKHSLQQLYLNIISTPLKNNPEAIIDDNYTGPQGPN